jgi:hypothetical protein
VGATGATGGTGATGSAGSGLYTTYIRIIEQQTSGTPGGTATSGAWRTRNLTTITDNVGGLASLSSNQILLPAGTYRCEASCPAEYCGRHEARLQDITHSTTLLYGAICASSPGDGWANTRAPITGRFTLADATVIEVQHQVQTTNAINGFGGAGSFSVETYTTIEFWKE